MSGETLKPTPKDESLARLVSDIDGVPPDEALETVMENKKENSSGSTEKSS